MDTLTWLGLLLFTNGLSLILGICMALRSNDDKIIQQRLATYATRPPEPIYTVADIHFFSEMQRKLGEE